MTSSGRSGGLARTAPLSAPHAQLPLSEELFSAVLEQCRPSRSRVEAVARLALQHPANAVDVWTALRKALIGEADLNSRHNQALWYVVDSLLKHATYIFQPLMAPRLLEYVIQQMPWHLVQWSSSVVEATAAGSSSSTSASSPANRLMWCERLVHTWEHYLPASIFLPIRQHAIHCRSEAELGGALSSSSTAGGGGMGGGGAMAGGVGAARAAKTVVVHPSDPATPEALRQLTENWQTFYYWCRALEEQQQRRAAPSWLQQVLTAAATAAAATAAAENKSNPSTTSVAQPGQSGPSQASQPSGDVSAGEDEAEDEDDYNPEFMAGVTPRALPQLDLPRRRREARRRPRDDDDL